MAVAAAGDITALIPAAGLGTRMVPATKEIPKEMLPVPYTRDGAPLFKPFIQVVFEHLYEAGIRVFVVVVGRGKRILQDHFVADWSFQEYLAARGKEREARELERFYSMLEDSTIIWVDQPTPRGLGDAVARGLKAVSAGRVLIHLGDILLHSPGHNHVRDLIETAASCSECTGTISLQPVDNPKSYGVASPAGRAGCTGETPTIEALLRIADLVEKPSIPPSRLAIAGIYLLPAHLIREALQRSGENPRTGEKELTDALRLLAREGRLCGAQTRRTAYIDIGKPERYLQAIRMLAGDKP